MEVEKKEKIKNEAWYRPVMFFYVKTTSWIIFPLIIGLIAGRFTENQILFFVCLILAFGITCAGIYREIKDYKKSLNSNGK